MATILLAIGLIGIFFIFMSVRLIFLKNGKFKGTCASQSPWLKNEGGTCGYCGRQVDDGQECQNDDESPVKKVLSKF
jgi:hypothetical protein